MVEVMDMNSTHKYPLDAVEICLFRHLVPLELRYHIRSYVYIQLDDRTIRDAVKLLVQQMNCDDAAMKYDSIARWDVRKVTSMSELFYSTYFNDNIEEWDVSNVRNMADMFCDCRQFNQPLNKWDVKNVVNMSGMFSASAFNQPLDSWQVNSVVDMTAMFYDTYQFNQPLNSWNVSSVTSMLNMFAETTAFNQPLDRWDVGRVTIMSAMFRSTQAFNQQLETWDVRNVTDISYMFYDAVAFNQPLDGWNVRNVTECGLFLGGENKMFRQKLISWQEKLPEAVKKCLSSDLRKMVYYAEDVDPQPIVQPEWLIALHARNR